MPRWTFKPANCAFGVRRWIWSQPSNMFSSKVVGRDGEVEGEGGGGGFGCGWGDVAVVEPSRQRKRIAERDPFIIVTGRLLKYKTSEHQEGTTMEKGEKKPSKIFLQVTERGKSGIILMTRHWAFISCA